MRKYPSKPNLWINVSSCSTCFFARSNKSGLFFALYLRRTPSATRLRRSHPLFHLQALDSVEAHSQDRSARIVGERRVLSCSRLLQGHLEREPSSLWLLWRCAALHHSDVAHGRVGSCDKQPPPSSILLSCYSGDEDRCRRPSFAHRQGKPDPSWLVQRIGRHTGARHPPLLHRGQSLDQ